MTSQAQPGPQSARPSATDAQLQSALDNSIWYLLSLWPALHIACTNNWGGPDSSDKRDWFAGAVSELITSANASSSNNPTTTTTDDPAEQSLLGVDADYLSDFLLQIMADEFDCHVEDESEQRVAEDILLVAERLLRERSTAAAQEVEARWRNRSALRTDVAVEDVNQDVDAEVDEDGDEDLDDAPALVPAAAPPREKVLPEVDEDGFTKVVSKKKR